MKKIFLILFLIIVLAILLVFGLVKEAKTGSEHNVSGWAWSENIGWISFNNITGGGTANYGVHINPSTGVFSGYAWSENIGWIDFAPAGDFTNYPGCGYPQTPCYSAQLNLSNYQVYGWARALAYGGGWDGWIKLRGTTQDGNIYSTSWNSSTQELEGWAWSDMVIGWISFNCKNTGVCANSNYKVIAQLDSTPPTVSVLGAPANWQNTDATASVFCTDTGTGCDTGTHKLKTYSTNPSSCPTTYADYNLSSPQTISSRTWVCATAKDLAGNIGFCGSAQGCPVEFKVDQDPPTSLINSPLDSWLRKTTAANHYYLKTTDEDLGGSELNTAECKYEICSYQDLTGDGVGDVAGEKCSGSLSRACNITTNTLEIFVGDATKCSDAAGWKGCCFEAKNACAIFASAKDNAGNTGESYRNYNVDWTFPTVGKLYITGNEADQTYPIRVQEGVNYTFKARVTDNLAVDKIKGCELYIDDIKEGNMTLPDACTTDCVATRTTKIIGAGTYSNNYAICWDKAGNGKQGASVNIEVKTLSVDLTADPSSGTILTNFDLKASVSGTMTGTVNFMFDCRNDGTWEAKYDGINLSISDPNWVARTDYYGNTFYTKITSPDTFAIKDLCDYPTTGTYTAKVFIERGTGSAQNTANITVSANLPPVASIACHPSGCENPAGECVGYTKTNFCLKNNSTDPNGIDDIKNSIWTITGPTNEISNCMITPLCNWTLPSHFTEGSYTATLYAEDQSGASNTSAPKTFTIKQDAIADFKCSLDNTTWQNCGAIRSSVGETVYFLDQSSPSEGASLTNWAWSFQDGSPATGSGTNPSTQFQSAGSKSVSLTITDSVGRSASKNYNISVQLPLPEWQEIAPF